MLRIVEGEAAGRTLHVHAAKGLEARRRDQHSVVREIPHAHRVPKADGGMEVEH